jgi:hypothetical protein
MNTRSLVFAAYTQPNGLINVYVDDHTGRKCVGYLYLTPDEWRFLREAFLRVQGLNISIVEDPSPGLIQEERG